jgi:hypothetical protein
MQVAEGGPPAVDDELLLELDDEELDDEELDDDFPLLELDEDELLLELEEEELDDDLPLLELDDEELDEDLPLLELDEEELLDPPVTVSDVIVGRPVPFPQKPNDAVPPLAASAWL